MRFLVAIVLLALGVLLFGTALEGLFHNDLPDRFKALGKAVAS